MTREEARTLLFATIARVAPGADAGAVADTADLRRELDLDSFDRIQILTLLSKALGRDIPERDYSLLGTIRDAVDYLSREEGSSSDGTPRPPGGAGTGPSAASSSAQDQAPVPGLPIRRDP